MNEPSAMTEGLESLISPRAVDDFAAHWARRALYIPGAADKFAGLFDRAAFFRALAAGHASEGRARSGFSIRARFDRKGDIGAPVPELFLDPVEAPVALKGGATLCVNAICEGSPRLRALADRIKAQLSYPGAVRFNAYLSPPGCGARTHFDARVATVLQIAGTKRWRHDAAAAIDWPRGNGHMNRAGQGAYNAPTHGTEAWEQIRPMPPSEAADVVLTPGAFLCLPAGTWHECMAGDEESLALNLAFEPVSPLDVIMRTLRQRLEHAPAWRGTPVFPSLDDRHGELSDQIDAYLHARTTELLAAVEALRAAPEPLKLAWGDATAAPARQSAARPPSRPLQPSDRLRIRPGSTPVWTELAGAATPTLVLWIAGARLELTDPGARALVRQILAAADVTGQRCLEWSSAADGMTWARARSVLQVLVEAGLLEVLPDDPQR